MNFESLLGTHVQLWHVIPLSISGNYEMNISILNQCELLLIFVRIISIDFKILNLKINNQTIIFIKSKRCSLRFQLNLPGNTKISISLDGALCRPKDSGIKK